MRNFRNDYNTMQVRDLIEELKRHDPHKEVKVELRAANETPGPKPLNRGRDDYHIDSINPASLAGTAPVLLVIRHDCCNALPFGV